MGTNVYARRILSEEIKERIQEALRMNQYSEIEFLIYENSEPIHIGKRSCGWQFLFEENKRYYENNRKSINEFISREDIILYNEYDDPLTPEIFWKEYVDSMKDGDTYESYYMKSGFKKEYERVCTSEFISDGLRFTWDKDWS